jgi:type II secretory pathway component PulK
MKRRSPGLALITVVSIVAAMIALQWGLCQTLRLSQHRLRVHKLTQVAESMSQSGLDYARGRLGRDRWTPPRNWRSPSYDGAWFELTVQPQGAGWKIVSTGVAGHQRVTQEGKFP